MSYLLNKDTCFITFASLWTILLFIMVIIGLNNILKEQDSLVPTSTDIVETQQDRLLKVFLAVCVVESDNDPNAHNASTNALGIAQITPILVEDVNRIIRQEKYTHQDAKSVDKSFEMFKIYSNHYYSNGTPEQWARAWYGGPRGPEKESTLAYWEKVKYYIEIQRAARSHY